MAQALLTNTRATVFNPSSVHPNTLNPGKVLGRIGEEIARRFAWRGDFRNAHNITAYRVRGEAAGVVQWLGGGPTTQADIRLIWPTTQARVNGNTEAVPGRRLTRWVNTIDSHSVITTAYSMLSTVYSRQWEWTK